MLVLGFCSASSSLFVHFGLISWLQLGCGLAILQSHIAYPMSYSRQPGARHQIGCGWREHHSKVKCVCANQRCSASHHVLTERKTRRHPISASLGIHNRNNNKSGCNRIWELLGGMLGEERDPPMLHRLFECHRGGNLFPARAPTLRPALGTFPLSNDQSGTKTTPQKDIGGCMSGLIRLRRCFNTELL